MAAHSMMANAYMKWNVCVCVCMCIGGNDDDRQYFMIFVPHTVRAGANYSSQHRNRVIVLVFWRSLCAKARCISRSKTMANKLKNIVQYTHTQKCLNLNIFQNLAFSYYALPPLWPFAQNMHLRCQNDVNKKQDSTSNMHWYFYVHQNFKFLAKGPFLGGTWNNTFSHSPHCVRHRPTALNPFACRCAGMCLRTHSHYFPKWMCRAIQLYIRFSMPYTLNLNVPFKFAAWNLGTLLLLFISESLQCTTSSSLLSVEYAVLSNHRNACTGERERMEIRMKLLRIQWGTSNLQGFHIPLHSCTQRNCAAATQKTVANRSVSVGWSNNARLNATAISPSIIHMTNNKYASIVM